ncbi:hypothetical protein GGR54DRAFT_592334 [Hypoxylon sp. NC1633]|nr:hypothetical protein GGR54DRAFT_592334 [Hypoxylon sp. NC1633]
MNFRESLFALFAFIAVAWAAAHRPVIFHGTAVLVPQGNKAASTKREAEFFSYMTDKGYFSFGWWLPIGSGSDTSLVQPDSESFHWLELGKRKSCNPEEGTCLYRSRNIPMQRPADAELGTFLEGPLEYVLDRLDLENGGNGQLAFRYTDSNGDAVYGKGTARNLSDKERSSGECLRALRTLKHMYEIYDVDLGFEIGNPCTVGANRHGGVASEL